MAMDEDVALLDGTFQPIPRGRLENFVRDFPELRSLGSIRACGLSGTGSRDDPDGRGWFRTSDLSRVRRALSH